jgi:hypothetical protein
VTDATYTTCDKRAVRETLGKRLTVEIFHDQEGMAVLVTDIEQRADMRMAERRDDARARSKRSRNCGSEATASGNTSIATIRSSRVSRAR